MLTSEESKASIVLVHGAFVDGSGWKAVHAALSARGHEVLVVQNPTITLDGDVAATRRVIDAARHPVVFVGHSYGGAVITEAGEHPQVKALVYIAAFVPDLGESVFFLSQQALDAGEPQAPVLPPQDGFLVLDPARFPEAFAADVPVGQTRFMAAAQVPWGLGAATAELTRTAWRHRPSHYLIATGDRMIPPDAQRRMAKRANAWTAEIYSSHAAMLSRPDEVSAFIENAAESALLAQPAW